MTKARPVIPGSMVMLTRRIRQRCFLLRPSANVNQLILYVTAVAAKKWKMKLHALTYLSNHSHTCATDPHGNVIRYQADCHQFIARALNTKYDEEDSIWSTSQPSRLDCETPPDLVHEIAYTLANPVKAGLVRQGKDWPGVRLAWPCEPSVVKRPSYFFADEVIWPKEITLEFFRPPGYEEFSEKEVAAIIERESVELEDKARAENDDKGWSFLGVERILKQPRHSRPKTTRKRSKKGRKSNISPKVACRDPEKRVARLLAHVRFVADYAVALTRWRSGHRDVLFPYGTYRMCVLHGAATGPPT